MKTIKNIPAKAFIMLIAMVLTLGAGIKAQETKTFDVDEFNKIDIGGIFEVYVTQSDQHALKIEANAKSMEKITTEVKNNTLYLGIKKKGMKNFKTPVAYINVKKLNGINAHGAVELETENTIETENFKLDISGAADGDIKIKTKKLETSLAGAANLDMEGEAESHTIEVSGAGSLDATELKTKKTDIEVSGAANAEIHASEEVNGNISGMGNIEIKGNPKVRNITTSGLGEVKSSDTAKFSIGNKKFIVVDDEELEFEDIKEKKKKKYNFDAHWAGFGLATNWYVDNEFSFDSPEYHKYLELNRSKSIGVDLDLWDKDFNLWNEKFGFSTGIGFSFLNYRFEDTRVLLGNDRDTIYGYVKDSSLNADKSKLNLSFLTLPLVFEYQTPLGDEELFIGAGAVGGLRIGSKTKIKYSSGSDNKEHKSFHTNPVYYAAVGYIGWGSMSLYGKYGLSTLFEEGEGPELYPFSIGLKLTF